MLLLLSRFSCVRLCATPETAAHQAPLSLGFSRQEHWSGLPFPSPMHESEKWSRSAVSDSSRPHGLQPTRLLHPCGFPGKSTVVGCHCLLRDRSERLLQRSSRGRSIYKILVKGKFNAINWRGRGIQCLLYKMFSVSHEQLMSHEEI